MLETVILSYLLTEFMLALLGKFNMFNRFRQYAMKSNSKFLYRLSNCDFCLHFHLCVFSSFVLFCFAFDLSAFSLHLIAYFLKINLTYLLTPVFASGLKFFINGIKNK